MLGHGCNIFENAQDARAVLFECGFEPLVRLGRAEHFVRDAQRCTLVYEGDIPHAVPLDDAAHVWFTRFGRQHEGDRLSVYEIVPSFA